MVFPEQRAALREIAARPFEERRLGLAILGQGDSPINAQRTLDLALSERGKVGTGRNRASWEVRQARVQVMDAIRAEGLDGDPDFSYEALFAGV